MSEDSVILDDLTADESFIFDCSGEWWSKNEEDE